MSAPELELGQWKRTRTAGPDLHYAVCRSAKPKAGLAVAHGFADYAERYGTAMKVWAEHGLTSVCVDLRGHGRSEGPRGYIDAISDYVDDFREMVAILEAKAPALPRVLFGHSFGAVVSLKSLLTEDFRFRAVALTEPYLATAFEVPALKKAAGKLASKVLPSLSLPTGLNGAQMSTDADEQRKYDTDPLIFKIARARWFTETLATQAEIVNRANEFSLPLYLLFATNDPVVSEPVARKFFDGCSSKDKKWETLEGLRHEPLNEPAHGAAIAARIGDWLASRA